MLDKLTKKKKKVMITYLFNPSSPDPGRREKIIYNMFL